MDMYDNVFYYKNGSYHKLDYKEMNMTKEEFSSALWRMKKEGLIKIDFLYKKQ